MRVIVVAIAVVIVAAAVAAIVTQLPDIQRYLNMRSM
jgi:hypothetical protein